MKRAAGLQHLHRLCYGTCIVEESADIIAKLQTVTDFWIKWNINIFKVFIDLCNI
jgi:hypothetical protein